MRRPILLEGREPRFPLVCAPIVARTEEALLREARQVASLAPDLVEWRVDFYERISDPAHLASLALRVKEAAGGLPILFTRRSSREGGQPIAIGEEAVAAAYEAVCATGAVALADWEMEGDAGLLREVRGFTKGRVQLVLSFHDFRATPPEDELVQRFARAQEMGADVAKLAVMPRDMGDVLSLLRATHAASERAGIPLVSMAMGPLGAVTRVAGFAFGSAMTFAVGQDASAPGQMPIADVTAALGALQRAMRP